MSLDRLLDELEPVSIDDLEVEEQPRGESSEQLYDALSHMLELADRVAKTGYRAGQSTEYVGEQVAEMKEFMEAEVEAREKDLRRTRSELGELTDERDRLVRALMETADLVGSATEAARNELDEDVAARFDRLQSHVGKVLHRASLEPVAEEGESFDPEFHEAVDQVADETAEPRSIVEVIRQGYRYRGEPVRIARVIVAE